MSEGEVPVSGTLIWYYAICPRQVWLMAHQLNPDEDNPFLEYGRFLQREAYRREKKELSIEAGKLDFIDVTQGKPVVVEVKKSSRAVDSARLQLGHYLLALEENGIHTTGELRFPEERRRETIVLDEKLRAEVLSARSAIRRLVVQNKPPHPKRIKWCRHCAYAELCWA